MGNFDQKVNKFIEIFVEQNGYAKVISGSAEYTVNCSDRFNHWYRCWNFDCNSACTSKV